MDATSSELLSPEQALVTANLARWAEVVGGLPVLVNLSENHTFRVDAPDGTQTVLRLHRPGYQSRAAIISELAWIEALRRDTDLPVPRPLAGVDGELVQEVAPDRFAVLFAFEPGGEPTPADDLVPLFRTLGGIAATTHVHVIDWPRPLAFARQVWDAESILDPAGLWGDWRDAPHVEGETLQTLTALDAKLRAALDAYGKGPDRYGLIHSDMRLANLLVDGARVTLIDFDDSGFNWFLYDLAASLSFIETSPLVPQLIRSWLAGYMQIRPLAAEDLRMIDAMILLRRMALLAWISSHGETELARAHAERFAPDTATLARRYLGQA